MLYLRDIVQLEILVIGEWLDLILQVFSNRGGSVICLLPSHPAPGGSGRMRECQLMLESPSKTANQSCFRVTSLCLVCNLCVQGDVFGPSIASGPLPREGVPVSIAVYLDPTTS